MYISQLIRFARVCSHIEDFNACNKCLMAKLLKQGYQYHKLKKAFSKFYCRHYDLISKFNVRLKSLLYQSISEPELYGDLVYKGSLTPTVGKCLWFTVKLKVCHQSFYAQYSYPDLGTL